MQIVIVSGLSGSGKSTAIRVLEDLGYYCIDNLPVALIPRFIELSGSTPELIARVGLGIDLRERFSLHEYPTVFAGLKKHGHTVNIIYLEAADEALVRRFSETRRPHPAAVTGGVTEGIRTEREQLSGLRALADHVIDTSTYTVHELRLQLRQRLESLLPELPRLIVTIESFGYKHGIPIDSDLMFDVRFLPNPFFVDELRPRTGLDRIVARFVLERAETRQFLERMSALLEFTLPLYAREGKSYLTIAIGCTGGQHRSVVVAEELGRRLAGWEYTAHLRHRDLQR